MDNRFEAAMEWLKKGQEDEKLDEDYYYAKNDPDFGRKAQKNRLQIEAAIRLLEAAGKVGKEDATGWLNSDNAPKELVRAILAALPDEVKP